METKIFYFSATGNSLYVAKKIAEKMERCELLSIAKMNNEEKIELKGCNIGLVFPLHSFGLPIIVEEFIKRLDIDQDTYIFAIQTTGGGSSKSSFKIINEILNKNKDNKVKLTTIGEVKYISNYIRAGKNATLNRYKEIEDESELKIENLIQLILQKEDNSVNVKGNKIHEIIHKSWKDVYKRKDSRFYSNETCTGCEICKKICPVNNIEIENKRVKWNKKCIDCMACINNCPQKAINIGKSTIKKARYRHPKVSIMELI